MLLSVAQTWRVFRARSLTPVWDAMANATACYVSPPSLHQHRMRHYVHCFPVNQCEAESSFSLNATMAEEGSKEETGSCSRAHLDK